MTRRSFLWVAGVGTLSGCGGGSGNNNTLLPVAGRVQAIPYATDQLDADYGDTVARVRVQWPSLTEIDSASVVGYRVYRDSVLVAAVSRASTLWIDRLPPLRGSYSEQLPPPESFEVLEPSSTDPATLVSRTATSPWLTVGVPHQYEVRALYKTGGSYLETALATEPVFATPIARPYFLISTPSQQLLDNISLAYQTVPGANEYLVELALNASFTGAVSHGPLIQEFVNAPTFTGAFDVSSTIPGQPGEKLYIRIGARHAQDTNPPRDRYVWSTTYTSTISGKPQPPPGGIS